MNDHFCEYGKLLGEPIECMSDIQPKLVGSKITHISGENTWSGPDFRTIEFDCGYCLVYDNDEIRFFDNKHKLKFYLYHITNSCLTENKYYISKNNAINGYKLALLTHLIKHNKDLPEDINEQLNDYVVEKKYFSLTPFEMRDLEVEDLYKIEYDTNKSWLENLKEYQM